MNDRVGRWFSTNKLLIQEMRCENWDAIDIARINTNRILNKLESTYAYTISRNAME